MKVLVTGGCGYIGSTLVPMLLDKGNEVTIVDIGWFNEDWFNRIEPRGELKYIKGDIRHPYKTWFKGIDAVIHLAAISNDPVAELYPDSNYAINAMGTALVAHMAKECGVKKFILASSCSVYGFEVDGLFREEDKSAPKYPYGISKLMSEVAALALMDSNFAVISLRKGTVGGYAPRMRFDLVVNTMTKAGIKDGVITVRNSTLWRPVVDVRDAARAYVLALETPDAYGVYNIMQGNYTIKQIGEAVQKSLMKNGIVCNLDVYDRFDLRNYRVSGDKALMGLNFCAEYNIESTVKEIVDKIKDKTIVDLNSKRYYNIEICKEIKGLR